jgi:hypothetical protein
VSPHPSSRTAIAFVASLRHDIEIVISDVQHVETAGIGLASGELSNRGHAGPLFVLAASGLSSTTRDEIVANRGHDGRK